jgi:transposase
MIIGKEKIEVEKIISAIIKLLQLFMPKTLVKRLLSMVLIGLEVPNKRVTELTGLCDKSVRVLRKQLEHGEIENLLQIKGGGRKGKLIDVEQSIIEEIEKNEYYSKQQIADMIYEKYGIKVSCDSVARLLKKKELNA